jgi:hypothetical protein
VCVYCAVRAKSLNKIQVNLSVPPSPFFVLIINVAPFTFLPLSFLYLTKGYVSHKSIKNIVHVSICVTISFRHFSSSYLYFLYFPITFSFVVSCVSVLYVFILCRLFTRVSSYIVLLHFCPVTARPLSPVDTFTPFTVDVATHKYRTTPQ